MANAPSSAIQRLIDVVAQLRDPTTGCPWDLEQPHASLVPYVLEEAHEVEVEEEGEEAWTSRSSSGHYRHRHANASTERP